MKADALRGQLDALVLATLRGGPAHGYAVIEALKHRSEGAFDLAEGAVYPVLHRLEADGLLSSSWSTPAGGGRRVYRRPRRGRTALAAGHDEWQRIARAIEAVLA